MTTIAYKDGVIACDGRSCSGPTIVSDQSEKYRIRQDGARFWFSGSDYLFDELMEKWPSGKMSSGEMNAFVFDGETLFFVSVSEEGVIQNCRHCLSTPFSIGSGGDHALTAMDMGASAAEAVEMAAKRDVHTGGKIRAYEIYQPPRLGKSERSA